MRTIRIFIYFTMIFSISKTVLCEHELTLDEGVDLFGHRRGIWGDYHPEEFRGNLATDYNYDQLGRYNFTSNTFRGVGYGSGGYGDPQQTSFNLNACTSRSVDQKNCTSDYPDTGNYEWRYVKNIGWRKFTRFGSQRKDWWDYQKTVGWPFHQTYGTLNGRFQ